MPSSAPAQLDAQAEKPVPRWTHAELYGEDESSEASSEGIPVARFEQVSAHAVARALPAAQDDKSEFIAKFALMYSSGLSLLRCAERLKKPVSVLHTIMQNRVFHTLVKDFLVESGDNTGEKLLKSSGVDNVMFLLSARDNPEVPMNLRVRIAERLLDRVYGQPKKHGMIGEEDNGELFQKSLEQGGSSLDDSLVLELKRRLASNPHLISAASSDTVPQQGLESQPALHQNGQMLPSRNTTSF